MSYPIQVVQLIEENKIEEAVQLLVRAVEEEPANPLHYVNLGSVLFQHKQYEEATSFFLRALELDENMATAHFGLGSVHYELGRYKDAATALRACLALNMEEADVYYLLGMSYIQLKNPLLASPFLQRATELKDNVDYLFQYGLALAQLEHYKEAERTFHRILQKDEHHVDTLYNLAIVHIHENRVEKGFELLKKVVKIESNHELANRALESFSKKRT